MNQLQRRQAPAPVPRPAAVIWDWDDSVATLRAFEQNEAIPAIHAYLVESQGVPARDVRAWCVDYMKDSGGMLTSSAREARAFAACTPAQRARIHFELKVHALSTVVPGVPRIIKGLRTVGVPCAVASNSELNRLHRNIAHAHLRGEFDAIVTSEEVGAAKPDPAAIIRAMDLLDIPAAERSTVIYIGNRPHDVVAAHAAGVRAWVVGFGIRRDHVPVEYQAVLALPGVEYFSSPTQLRARLKDVCGTAPDPGLR